MEIPVAFSCNDKYVFPLCIALASMKVNKKENTHYSIYILYSFLTDESKKMLMELSGGQFKIDLVNVAELTCDIQKKYEMHIKPAYISKESMYRLYLPELFPQYGKMIYLDCDVIVQDDLEGLYSTKLDDFYAGVVEDVGALECIKRMNCGLKEYFNSGVLLLNLVEMRDGSITEKLLSEPMEGKTLIDQDILNLVIGERVFYLSGKYNFMSTAINNNCVSNYEKYPDLYSETAKGYIEKAVVLHLTGSYKPWVYNIPFFSEIFLSYMKYTSYRDKELKLLEYNSNYRDFPVNQFGLPEYEIREGSRVVLYGAGSVGRAFFQKLVTDNKYALTHWVDKEAEIYSAQGFPVEPVKVLMSKQFDYIIIGVSDEQVAREIREELIEYDILAEQIVWKKPKERILPFGDIINEWKPG